MEGAARERDSAHCYGRSLAASPSHVRDFTMQTRPQRWRTYEPGMLAGVPQSRPFQTSVLAGKPVALMGAGQDAGTARSQLALRQVFVFTGSHVLPKREVYVRDAPQHFDPSGRLIDEKVQDQIRELLAALAAWTRLLARARV